MIAALYNIPNDPQTLARFAFHNRDAHVLVINAIKAKFGVALPEYPIDPIKMTDFPAWLYTHQSMHNAVNQVLGTPGNDLTDVDPNAPEQLAAWAENHASEHVVWGNLLGIG
jgi:hypothetical protein